MSKLPENLPATPLVEAIWITCDGCDDLFPAASGQLRCRACRPAPPSECGAAAQQERARMLREVAGLTATGLPAPVSLHIYNFSDIYRADPWSLQLRMGHDDTTGVDRWAEHLEAVAQLLPTVHTTSVGGWQVYEVRVSPAPWRGWREVHVWCERTINPHRTPGAGSGER